MAGKEHHVRKLIDISRPAFHGLCDCRCCLARSYQLAETVSWRCDLLRQLMVLFGGQHPAIELRHHAPRQPGNPVDAAARQGNSNEVQRRALADPDRRSALPFREHSGVDHIGTLRPCLGQYSGKRPHFTAALVPRISRREGIMDDKIARLYGDRCSSASAYRTTPEAKLVAPELGGRFIGNWSSERNDRVIKVGTVRAVL